MEVPRSFLSTLKAGFISSAQARLETALLTGRPHRGMESLRGCGCRSRAARRATSESRRIRRGPARALLSRSAGPGRERWAEVLLYAGEAILAFARLRTSGSTWAGSCRQSFGLGPGSVMNAMSRMSPPHPGHATGNSSPTRAMSFAFSVGRCRGRAVCRMSRSSRRWHLRAPHVRRPHAHQSRHRAACRHSPTARAVTADLSL